MLKGQLARLGLLPNNQYTNANGEVMTIEKSVVGH